MESLNLTKQNKKTNLSDQLEEDLLKSPPPAGQAEGMEVVEGKVGEGGPGGTAKTLPGEPELMDPEAVSVSKEQSNSGTLQCGVPVQSGSSESAIVDLETLSGPAKRLDSGSEKQDPTPENPVEITTPLNQGLPPIIASGNSAQRRRYVFLIRKGVEIESAIKQALEAPMKRKKAGDSADTTPDKRKDKKRRTHSDAPAPKKKRKYNEVAQGIKVGIFHANYPSVFLTSEQMNLIQDSIVEAIFELDLDGPKPGFSETSYRRGWLCMRCIDEESSNWLKSFIPSCKPWDGGNLKILDGKDLPKPRVATAFLPKCAEETNERIFHFLARQNRGLNVESWRVLSRKREGALSTLMTLLIDAESAEILESNPEVSIKLARGTIRPRLLNKEPQKNSEKKKAASKEVETPTYEDPVLQEDAALEHATLNLEMLNVSESGGSETPTGSEPPAKPLKDFRPPLQGGAGKSKKPLPQPLEKKKKKEKEKGRGSRGKK
ncbi:hypothetical protein GE061_006668 [Apolygus lucorum]|uniref:DUF4780 domain-containing protein n=1 Tax=Apolygus lucorum TaxID=248454 RepID=A0A6A4J4Q7_APOLU|nr:hypothetical protein GE061_006668 [Apolygus lucorum]